MRKGDLAGALSAAMAALDQAPGSPEGRRLAAEIRTRLETERTSAANQRRVDDLVDEGRGLLRSRDFRAAHDRFQEALALDSEHELAASYLELTEERLRDQRTAAARTNSTRTDTTTPLELPEPPAAPESGIARITVTFDSPLSSGTVALTLDGELLADVPFDFSTPGFLGLKKKGRGTVRRVVLTPSGEHTVGVELRSPERGLIGSASFSRRLAADSDWTLRIDLPREQAEANFFLVQRAR
jgi:hypothetical protein